MRNDHLRVKSSRLAAFWLMFALDGPSEGWAEYTEETGSRAPVVAVRGGLGFDGIMRFDPATSHLIELSYTYPRPGPKRPGRTGLSFHTPRIDPRFEIGDYRAAEGLILILPHEIVEVIPEGGRKRYLIEKITLNPPKDHPLYALVQGK